VVTSRRSDDVGMADGVGRVYHAGEPIARVYYTLDVKQVYIAAKAYAGSGERTRHNKVSGYLIVETGAKDLAEKEDLTLHLQDGRKLDFDAELIVPSRYIFAVKPRSEFYGF
jgi:hypothetical protein